MSFAQPGSHLLEDMKVNIYPLIGHVSLPYKCITLLRLSYIQILDCLETKDN